VECWRNYNTREAVEDFIMVLEDDYALIKEKGIDEAIQQEPKLLRIVYEYGKVLERNFAQKSFFSFPIDDFFPSALEMRYVESYIQCYVSWKTRAREASLTFLLCAAELGLVRDIARVIARMVYDEFRYSHFWKQSDFEVFKDDTVATHKSTMHKITMHDLMDE